MKKFLAATLCTFMLAGTIGTAAAQQDNPQRGSGMMGRQNTDQGQSMPGPFHRWQGMMQGDYGRMGYGMMSGRGWGGHMMGPGMMMGRMMGPEMMIVMMDTNGDGNLSLEEFQAVHARMFKMLDKDGDGQLTGEEIGPRWSTDDSDSDD